MKSLIVMAALALAQIASACPGSHLMTIKFGGQDAFVINMLVGKIERVESNKNVALAKLEIGGSTICVESPHSRSRCSNMFPALNILGKPGEVNLMGQQVDLALTLTDGRNTKDVKVARFPGLTRSARGCGPVVE